MARVAIPIVTMSGKEGSHPAGVAGGAPVAGDSVNGHAWTFNRGDICLVHNVGVGAIQATLKATAGKQGRTQDTVISVDPGETGVLRPAALGFKQGTPDNGNIFVDVDTDTDPELLVLRDPDA